MNVPLAVIENLKKSEPYLGGMMYKIITDNELGHKAVELGLIDLEYGEIPEDEVNALRPLVEWVVSEIVSNVKRDSIAEGRKQIIRNIKKHYEDYHPLPVENGWGILTDIPIPNVTLRRYFKELEK